MNWTYIPGNCPISSDPKDKREGVDRQREDTAILCEVKGWQVAGYYVDNDRSASNGGRRPEWERLLADIEAGKIDAVAAWDQDRVNRAMDDFQRYKNLFVRRGIKLATSNNGDIDLSTPSGVLTATIKTAVSEHEISMMKIRMRRAAKQKAQRGLPKWKRAFGYLGDTYQLDPHTAPLVKQVYAHVLAGGSITDGARILNAQNAFGLSGKPWTASTLSLFLRKARNAGLREHNDEIVRDEDGNPVKGTWPALVDESTWHAAQSVLNAPGRAPGRKSVRRHLLTGVLKCGKCGSHVVGQWTKQGSIAYSCRACRGVSIRAEHVEPMVYDLVAGRLAMNDAADLLKAEQHDQAEAEALRIESNTLSARLDSLAVEHAEGLLTARQVKISTDVINEKLAKLQLRQQDQERLRVFDGLPLGTPEVRMAVRSLSADRLRAVLSVLMEITIAPVGKRGHTFNPERVQVNWR